MELDQINFPNLPNYNVSLYDKNDAGKGIVYKIMNGEYCTLVNKNKELNINLVCPSTERLQFNPDNLVTILNETIEEGPTCTYTLEYESPLACPLQCITKNDNYYSVCNAHGVCAPDPKLGMICYIYISFSFTSYAFVISL